MRRRALHTGRGLGPIVLQARIWQQRTAEPVSPDASMLGYMRPSGVAVSFPFPVDARRHCLVRFEADEASRVSTRLLGGRHGPTAVLPANGGRFRKTSPPAQRGARSHAKRSDAARRPPLPLRQISLPPWTVPGEQPATRVRQAQPKNDRRGRRRPGDYPQPLRRREDAQHRFGRRAGEFAGERRAPPEPKPPPRNGRAHGALAKDMCAAGETLASARDQSTTCDTN